MVCESWNVFTKQVLVEKHIRGIMYENLGGGARSPAPLFRRPNLCIVQYCIGVNILDTFFIITF